jgi:hypothetical protein
MLENSELDGEQVMIGRYRLESGLGLGYTARVYRALDTSTGEQVALKVMKPGLPQGMQKRFKDEAMVLADLHAAQAKRELPNSLIVGLRGMDLEHEPPYIALELLKSRTVLHLLMERGRFKEQEALTIGGQFCRVMQLLHEDLARSYTDMKLDNIWWDGEWITVSDWNIVSEVGEADVEQDLLNFGKHLYRMVTGVALDPESGGFGQYDLAKKSGGAWGKALSWGMQGVLHRALHRNREERFPDAFSLAQALWNLSKIWDAAAKDLPVEAGAKLSGNPSCEQADQALTILDIAKRRADGNEEVILKLIHKAEQVLQAQETSLARGRSFWRAADYRSAAEALEDSIEDGVEELEAWRLLGLARLGMERPAEMGELRDRIEDALHDLTEGSFAWAEKRFRTISELAPDATAVVNLEREARVQRLVQEAERARPEEDWETVAEAYSSAWDALQTMQSAGHREALAARLPDLKAGATRARALARSKGVAENKLEAGRLYLNTSAERARSYFREGLEADPGNEALLGICIEETLASASQGRWDEAMEYCEIAISGAPQRAAFRQLWLMVEQTRDAVDALRFGHWTSGTQSASRLLADYVAVLSGSQETAQWRSDLLPPLLSELGLAFRSAIDSGEYTALYEILDEWLFRYGQVRSLGEFLQQHKERLDQRLDRQVMAQLARFTRGHPLTLEELYEAVQGAKNLYQQLPHHYLETAESRGPEFRQQYEAWQQRLEQAKALWSQVEQGRTNKEWVTVINGIDHLEQEIQLSGQKGNNDWRKHREEALLALSSEQIGLARELLDNAQAESEIAAAQECLQSEEVAWLKSFRLIPQHRELREDLRRLDAELKETRKQWPLVEAGHRWASSLVEAAAGASKSQQARWVLKQAERECHRVLDLHDAFVPTQLLLEQIHQQLDRTAADEGQMLIEVAAQFLRLGALGRARQALDGAERTRFLRREAGAGLHQQVDQMRQQLAGRAQELVDDARQAWKQDRHQQTLILLEGLRGIDQEVCWIDSAGREQNHDISALIEKLLDLR